MLKPRELLSIPGATSAFALLALLCGCRVGPPYHLTTFQQVEDALAATRVYSQLILRQQEAVKSSQEFLDLEMQRYNSGVDPYVDVVTAQTTVLANLVTLNSLQVEELLSAVQLVQALGGEWDRNQLPTPAQVSAKRPPQFPVSPPIRQISSDSSSAMGLHSKERGLSFFIGHAVSQL